jgi:hypothetical protein
MLLRERTKVLDDWLFGQFGSDWEVLKRAWGVTPDILRVASTRDLWRFFLPALHLVRLVEESSQTESHKGPQIGLAALQQSPQVLGQIHGVLPSDPKITILGNHISIVSDLATAWHSSLEGKELKVLDRDMNGATTKCLQSAFDLFARTSRRSLELVVDECGAICLIVPVPDLGSGYCVSLTSKLVPGIVYLSSVPTILSAESMVHEAAHLRLYRRELKELIYVDPNRLVSTPLRTDLRPVSGLLHQVWVLVHLCEMYDELQSDRTELMQINREKVRLRLLRHRDDLNRGLTALNAVAEAFAPAGHSLISELSIRAQELSYAD